MYCLPNINNLSVGFFGYFNFFSVLSCFIVEETSSPIMITNQGIHKKTIRHLKKSTRKQSVPNAGSYLRGTQCFYFSGGKGHEAEVCKSRILHGNVRSLFWHLDCNHFQTRIKSIEPRQTYPMQLCDELMKISPDKSISRIDDFAPLPRLISILLIYYYANISNPK